MSEIYPAVRSLFFKLDPEQAHALSLSMIRIAGALPPARALLRRIFAVSAHPVEAFNLKFSKSDWVGCRI
jgi:hypothetical protein